MKAIATFAGSLIASFFTVALVWYKTVQGRLYVCTDPIPVLEYFGSHVHGVTKNTRYVQPGEDHPEWRDHYNAPKWVVDALWWFSFGIASLLAGAATYLLRGKKS